MKVGRYLIVFLFVMALLIAFGNNGIIDNLLMKEKLKILKDASSQLMGENNKLRHEIKLLRSSPQHIETVARDELGMVRKGEIIYKFAE